MTRRALPAQSLWARVRASPGGADNAQKSRDIFDQAEGAAQSRITHNIASSRLCDSAEESRGTQSSAAASATSPKSVVRNDKLPTRIHHTEAQEAPRLCHREPSQEALSVRERFVHERKRTRVSQWPRQAVTNQHQPLSHPTHPQAGEVEGKKREEMKTDAPHHVHHRIT